MVAKVAVEKTNYAFDKQFTYLVPAFMEQTLAPGCRVLVPFGGGNRKRQGLVLALEEAAPPLEQPPHTLKEIVSQIDPAPVLGPEQMSLLEFLRQSCFCTYYDGVKVLIPSGLGVNLQLCCSLNRQWHSQREAAQEELPPGQEQIVSYLRTKRKQVPLAVLRRDLGLAANNPDMAKLIESGAVVITEDVRQKVADSKMIMARLCPPYEDENQPLPKATQKQRAVVELLRQVGCASVKELSYFCSVTPGVVHTLEKHGVVELFGRQLLRNPYENKTIEVDPSPVALTPDQAAAAEALFQVMAQGTAQTALLYGVTGSGKTQVFLRLIQQTLAQGKSVIIMVPEISLTPQTVEVFQKKFGKEVAVLHSGLTLGERADEYRRIAQGGAKVVIGTRSAVFAPLKNIGMVVMDEEQEQSYKSEQTPKFHARDVAKYRCRYHNALLLLASATPSVESFYYARRGKYHMVALKERYQGRLLPAVTIVDMSEQYGAVFSPQLAREIQKNLDQGEQTILLINRRGYNTIVKCSSCGEVATCPNCAVALNYHSDNGRLMCHYCGYSQTLVEKCKACGSQLMRYAGAGTQKIEEQLACAFPRARVLRMDADTTLSRFAHEKKFAAFAAGEYDIMVGTQMVAKGHNFPNVTLVGVINADQSLYTQDFRSYENTFSLLTQVVGRCGRGDLPGRAYIQTANPNQYVIEQAARQDYDSFYETEIAGRKLGLYPPYCNLCLVGFTGENQSQVRRGAEAFAAALTSRAAAQYGDLPLRILKPCEPAVEKIAGKHRYKLVIKCRQGPRVSQLLWELLAWFNGEKAYKNVTVTVDMNFSGIM